MQFMVTKRTDKAETKLADLVSEPISKLASVVPTESDEEKLQAPIKAITPAVIAKMKEKKEAKLRNATEMALVQKELTKLEQHNIRKGGRLLIIVEGRDACGKDSTIRRTTEKLSPREIRVVALGKPSDRECSDWYFKRYIAHLPAAGEIVFFNRSWYNRAGVEHVMNFCTKKQYQDFLSAAPVLEELLVNDGITVLKYYLDVSLAVQSKRLEDRKHDPMKHWKYSPVDDVAIKNWKAYSKARDVMLSKTSHAAAPWHIVRSDSKPLAHLNLMRDILSRIEYGGKKAPYLAPDPKIVFAFDVQCLKEKLLQN
jgi:polyphosphate kinase 2